MRSAASLGSLVAVLCLVLAWEIVAPDGGAPEDGVDRSQSRGTAATPSVGTAAMGPDTLTPDALTRIAASIAERPLFTPGRRAPARPASTTAAAVVAPEALPRLTGVIVGPSGGRAIFTGTDGKSRAAAEGDAVGTFKVRTIGPGLVTLSGSEGDRVLRPAYVTPPTASHAATPVAVGGGQAREGVR